MFFLLVSEMKLRRFFLIFDRRPVRMPDRDRRGRFVVRAPRVDAVCGEVGRVLPPGFQTCYAVRRPSPRLRTTPQPMLYRTQFLLTWSWGVRKRGLPKSISNRSIHWLCVLPSSESLGPRPPIPIPMPIPIPPKPRARRIRNIWDS